MKNKKVIYYNDELNDEFSEAKIIPRRIDENYKYFHNPLWDFCSFLIQNVLSIPLKFGYNFFKFRHRYVGKEKLKKYKKTGYFIYANHTQPISDTFTTSNAIYPKRSFIIANPENISMKGMKTFVEMLGAIPVPGNKGAFKIFLRVIDDKIKKGYAISIYPEAHIWPYYTKIRPFKSVSFKYPVKLNTPVFCMTNTYQVRGKDKVKMVTYIDGPFFANEGKTDKERQQILRDKVYKQMCERSMMSNIEVIEYKKRLS